MGHFGPDGFGRFSRGGFHWWVIPRVFVAVAIVSLAVVAIVWLVRGRRGWSSFTPPLGRSSAEQMLADRFARGEIDADEFRSRIETLRGAPPQSP